MWRFLLVGVCAALLAGCNQSLPHQSAVAVRSEGNPAAATADPVNLPVEGYVVGRPVRFGNLAVFPVSTREPRTTDRFITLDEGRAAKTVKVLEVGAEELTADGEPATEGGEAPSPNPPAAELASGPTPQPDGDPFGDDPFTSQPPGAGANQVNRLVVINTSDKPLYLMPGETIVGGSQDRTIGRELVIQPDGKPFPVDVFCVESGRWGQRGEGQTQEFVGNLSLVIASDSGASEEDLEQAAVAANRGEFIASAGALTKDARLAVVRDQDQSKVWDEVALHNAKANLDVPTGAFTANYASQEVAGRFQPYVEHLLAPVRDTQNVVGVIVAINGKVDSLDVFESTPLFTKLWPKLLRSFALDAATRSEEEGADMLCPRRKAHAFLVEATSAEVEETETQDGIALVRRASDDVVSFTAGEASADFSGSGFGGGFGGVHAAAFAH
jgi:hypothetical protein